MLLKVCQILRLIKIMVSRGACAAHPPHGAVDFKSPVSVVGKHMTSIFANQKVIFRDTALTLNPGITDT
jgi:hypothetical protein